MSKGKKRSRLLTKAKDRPGEFTVLVYKKVTPQPDGSTQIGFGINFAIDLILRVDLPTSLLASMMDKIVSAVSLACVGVSSAFVFGHEPTGATHIVK